MPGKQVHVEHPPATSLLLQGNPKVAKRTLFLFPDGSGAAAAYRQLSRINDDVAVYGLNCPYLKTPQDWKCGPQHLTPQYLAEIRRRQPQGPYSLGGWSTGGICAFDAARALDNEGEKVEHLILIDAPCPIGLRRLPPRLMEFLKGIRIFEGSSQSVPAWLFPHFEANTDALQKYRPRPFPPYHEPRTHILWAGRGVCEDADRPQLEIRDDDPFEMKWIMGRRDDFGPLGWDRLLNPDDIHIKVLDDADHFAMMRGEKARQVAKFLQHVMG